MWREFSDSTFYISIDRAATSNEMDQAIIGWMKAMFSTRRVTAGPQDVEETVLEDACSAGFVSVLIWMLVGDGLLVWFSAPGPQQAKPLISSTVTHGVVLNPATWTSGLEDDIGHWFQNCL